jgi:hypothetical protein
MGILDVRTQRTCGAHRAGMGRSPERRAWLTSQAAAALGTEGALARVLAPGARIGPWGLGATLAGPHGLAGHAGAAAAGLLGGMGQRELVCKVGQIGKGTGQSRLGRGWRCGLGGLWRRKGREYWLGWIQGKKEGRNFPFTI